MGSYLIHRTKPYFCRSATIIELEIGNASEYVVVHWLKLPHSPSCYTFDINSLTASVSVERTHGCFSMIQIMADEVSMTNNLIEWPIKLPKSVWANAMLAKRVRKLIAQSYYLVINVTNRTGIRCEPILIKAMVSAGAIIKTIRPVENHLEPVVENNSGKQSANPEEIEMTQLSANLYPSLDGM